MSFFVFSFLTFLTSHYSTLLHPSTPHPPDLTMFAVYEGIVSPSTYPVQKLKKSRCRIFLTRHFHENSGKKISKFGKKILNVVIFIFQCF